MKILDKNHIITGDEYIRQTDFFEYDGDNYARYSFISHWMSIRYLLGPVWKNKSLNNLLETRENSYYEYILFDNNEEKNLVKIYTDNEIKGRADLSWHIFRLWDDWIDVYWKNLSKEEQDKLMNFKAYDICPVCKNIKLSKNNTCYKCKFGYDKLLDDYKDWLNNINEIKQIQEYILKRN